MRGGGGGNYGARIRGGNYALSDGGNKNRYGNNGGNKNRYGNNGGNKNRYANDRGKNRYSYNDRDNKHHGNSHNNRHRVFRNGVWVWAYGPDYAYGYDCEWLRRRAAISGSP